MSEQVPQQKSFDLKKTLSEVLRFKSVGTGKDRWFKSRFFIGIDLTNGDRILITEKGKRFKEDKTYSVIYKGQTPETEKEFLKLLSWLKITTDETGAKRKQES